MDLWHFFMLMSLCISCEESIGVTMVYTFYLNWIIGVKVAPRTFRTWWAERQVHGAQVEPEQWFRLCRWVPWGSIWYDLPEERVSPRGEWAASGLLHHPITWRFSAGGRVGPARKEVPHGVIHLQVWLSHGEAAELAGWQRCLQGQGSREYNT